MDLALDRIDAWIRRGLVPDRELIAHSTTEPEIGVLERASRPFDREHVLTSYGRTVEIESRSYPYVVLPGHGSTLCIHYSAFFGEWGDRRRERAQFAGWFHRLRMFWPLVQHSFLFLCDTFGADENGTYYKGVGGDFFVERAMESIQARVAAELDVVPHRIVTLGSSMGATAALRFALRSRYAGAIAVSPHIDLDISALRQGRLRHVAAVLGDNDVAAPQFRPVTREIARLVDTVRPLPRLVIQSMLDDDGVHTEQVVPLVEAWRAASGEVQTDFRPEGGHTSQHATAPFFSSAISWCLSGRISGPSVQ
jgi:pimeloyl-ACP methyl ester carboxylesterase